MIETRQSDEVSPDERVNSIGTSTMRGEASERDKIVRLEEEVSKLPQLEVVPRHYFAEGVYAREITIPKGAVLVGRVHKHSQINIVSRGDATVRTESGVIRVQAPYTVVSPRGAKRAIYAHEETVWTTILGTEETDPDVIEMTLTADSYEEYTRFCEEQLRLPQGER